MEIRQNEETARLHRTECPKVTRIVQKDIYVDDCLSGEDSYRLAFQSITLVLRKGGLGLKGFTFSGMLPPKDISEDGQCVKVAGMKWFTEIGNMEEKPHGKHYNDYLEIIEKFRTFIKD